MIRKIICNQWQYILFFILLATGIAIVFGAGMTYGFAPMDDYYLITQNLAVQSFSLHSVQWFFTHFDPELYIPVTFISFMIEYAIGGSQPWIFHLTNIILHFCNAVMVGMLMQQLTRSRNIRLFATLLFAFHPITVEAVVWISARKDLLATFFALATLLTALHAFNHRNRFLSIISLTLFTLGLLSKVSIASLPLILIALLWINKKETGNIIRSTAPFFLLSLLAGCIAVFGKTDVLHSVGFLDRIVLAGQAINRTLLHSIFPVGLHLYYQPFIPDMSITSWMSVLIPCIIMLFAFGIHKKSPLIALGILWFFAFLAPSILNIQTDIGSPGLTFAADRYAYLPLIGIVLIVTVLLQRVTDTIQLKSRHSIVNITLGCAIGIAMMFSWWQTSTWASASSLYRHAIEMEPTAVRARKALADLLRHENRLDEAFAVLKEGLAYGDDPLLHLAAGYVYAQAGQTAEAEAQFNKTIEHAGGSPEAIFAIAGLRLHEGKIAEAKALYEQVLVDEPLFIGARVQLATILFEEHSLAEAKIQIERILKDDPFNADAMALMKKL